MKTIFEESARSEILQRFRSLTPDRQPRWGKLTAPKMLAHVSDQLRMGLADIRSGPASGFLSTGFGSWLAIYVLPWPHGFKGPRESFTTDPEQWERDLASLEQLLVRYSKSDATAKWPDHPIFGRLTGRDWGALSYRHLRHHLTQFAA